MNTHDLKTWPPQFEAIRLGLKPYEVRRDDRGFEEGDILRLREWDPATSDYTGKVLMRSVIHILRGGQFGIETGFAVMAIPSTGDDPMFDGTDFAHPAWWRGEQYGTDAAGRFIQNVLKRGYQGHVNSPALHAAAVQIAALQAALTACADQFAFYAEEHRNAGKVDKAETNERFRDLARKALWGEQS